MIFFMIAFQILGLQHLRTPDRRPWLAGDVAPHSRNGKLIEIKLRASEGSF
jgi:hypothetical protein